MSVSQFLVVVAHIHIYISICLSIYLSSICLYLPICLSVYLSINQSIQRERGRERVRITKSMCFIMDARWKCWVFVINIIVVNCKLSVKFLTCASRYNTSYNKKVGGCYHVMLFNFAHLFLVWFGFCDMVSLCSQASLKIMCSSVLAASASIVAGTTITHHYPWQKIAD
jgi:hypothetical protein